MFTAASTGVAAVPIRWSDKCWIKPNGLVDQSKRRATFTKATLEEKVQKIMQKMAATA